MKETIEIIKTFFEKNEWKYRYDEENTAFFSGVNMENVLGNVRLYILVDQDYYNVYVVLNSNVEEKYKLDVAEFLHRANYGLRNGNFEIDYRDGEIRYKTFVGFKNADLSEEIVTESIMIGLAMVERYGKGLIKTMVGEGTPEDNVDECEK